MMSKVLVTAESLEDIATALRSKLKTGKSYKVSEMAAAVMSILTQDSVLLDAKTITENGTYDPEDDNLDGYSSVVVNVEGSGSTLISKTITANDTYDPTDDEADGYSEVIVNVPNSYSASDEGKVVSSGALVAQTALAASITANGTYDTTTNNSVTVNVPSSLTPASGVSF